MAIIPKKVSHYIHDDGHLTHFSSCMEILRGGGVSYLTARKNGHIRTHSFGASWSFHQFASYSKIHPYALHILQYSGTKLAHRLQMCVTWWRILCIRIGTYFQSVAGNSFCADPSISTSFYCIVIGAGSIDMY